MAMRLSGKNCRIETSYAKDGDRQIIYLFCESRLRGLKCPMDGKAGAIPFELGAACFEHVQRRAKKKG